MTLELRLEIMLPIASTGENSKKGRSYDMSCEIPTKYKSAWIYEPSYKFI